MGFTNHRRKYFSILLSFAMLIVTVACSSSKSSELKTRSEDLVAREGVRGGGVLIPSNWILDGSDGGGSGSMSTWSNPKNKNEWIQYTTGMQLGAWYLGDNASSIDPAGLLPDGAKVSRVSAKIFEYSYPGSQASPKSPFVIQGVFIADLDKNQDPLGYTTVEISLPEEKVDLVNQILKHEESTV